FKTLTPSQLEAFKILRKNLSDLQDVESQQFCTDRCLLRYLRARNYHIEKSEKMLRATLEWRKQNRPQDIKFSEVVEMAKSGAIYQNGRDRMGRPIVMIRPRNDPKSVPTELKKKNLMFWLEYSIKQMNEDNGIESVTLFVDFQGFSRKNLDMKSVMECVHILSDHCPERLGQAIFLDPPTMFWLFWKLVTPFFNEVTLSKVKFINSKKENGIRVAPEVLNYIAADQLEVEFGGENRMTFNRDTNTFGDNPIVQMSPNSLMAHTKMDETVSTSSEEDEAGGSDIMRGYASPPCRPRSSRSSQASPISAMTS
ncbi:hypothetical protein SAMD00019534_008150, partial [Acytostelium subglobosum LB1]|uniref:hypothetical protein n=1 Tax=Acytostelium subglobosum LB1 TaxID=1410327 RepID=UPI0006449FF3